MANFTAAPVNGRFISQDTCRGELDDPDQWHLYAYCANNPINYVDPSGHLRIARKLLVEASAIVLAGLKIIPSKSKHFSRNKDYNNEKHDLPQTEAAVKKKGWIKQSDADSACHQFNATKGYKNRKYLSPNKHKEAVYKYNKKKKRYEITVDPKDLGTYNFGISTNAHIWKDLVPYLCWGNNGKDTTTRSQRILKASIGKFAGHMGEIKSALVIMERTGL